MGGRRKNLRKWGIRDMRMLLSTWGSRGDVEPLAALALRVQELGAEALVAARLLLDPLTTVGQG